MQKAYHTKVFTRVAALLLTAMLVFTALPRGAKGESAEDAATRVQVDTDEHGNASKIPGSTQHVTLVAVPHYGYVFDHWRAWDISGNAKGYEGRYYGSQITVPIPVGKTQFRGYFRPADSPSLGVQVRVDPNNTSGGVVSGTKASADDKTEVTTTITATPRPGEEFSHWVVSSKKLNSYSPSADKFRDEPIYGQAVESTFYDRSMTITAMPGYLYTCTAYFVNTDNAKGVFTKTKLVNKDGTEITGVIPGTVTGDAVFNQDGVATQKTTLQATPSNAAYVFDHWELSRDGSPNGQYAANPLTVTVGNYRDVYTAVFKTYSESASGVFLDTSKYIENAAGSYADGGGYATGEKVYNPALGAGQTTTLQAFPESDQYVFDHWEKKDAQDQFQNYAVSNPYTVEVTGRHDVYRAVFTRMNVTTQGVFVESNNDAYGTVTGGKVYNPALGKGQQTTLQAYPVSDTYEFSHWTLKRDDEPAHDPISSTNPYTVNVEAHRDTYTAVFKAVDEGKGVRTKAVLLKPDGTIDSAPDPSPGTTSGDTNYVINGTKVNQTTIQAFPASNAYIFVRWELHQNNASAASATSTSNPYSVKVRDENDMYWAVFMSTPNNTPVPVTPNPTGIADAKNFKDVWRKFSSPIYSITRGSLEDLAKEVIGSIRSRYASVDPSVGESAAVAALEAQLAEKDVPKDRRDMGKLPEDALVSSDGELFQTEDIRAGDYTDIANEVVHKRFGKLYDYEILQVVQVTGPVGAGSSSRTMVWKFTGAAEGDRLLLLQFLPDGTQVTATPVADEDGALTFFLESAADSEYLLLKVFLLHDKE